MILIDDTPIVRDGRILILAMDDGLERIVYEEATIDGVLEA
ncbi:hypothetical protein [Natronolimnobius sp. AArcel1]|nr:hypothetical protein [Natronolimnobius sp. AArcel1]